LSRSCYFVIIVIVIVVVVNLFYDEALLLDILMFLHQNVINIIAKT